MQDYVEQRDGGYYIAGTRIKDRGIAGDNSAILPDGRPLVRVYGAIIFYLENQATVEAYLRDQERIWAEVRTKETGLPETLSVRLREAREHAAPGKLEDTLPRRRQFQSKDRGGSSAAITADRFRICLST